MKKTSELIKAADATLGANVLEAALEAERKRKQNQVVSKVAELVRAVDEHEVLKERLDNSITEIKLRIDAIRAGKFTLTRGGDLQFNEEKLNIAPYGKGNICRNCGMPVK